MYCYKCGCELGKEDHCPNCGTDVRTYKKIIYTSNYLYNDGLEKAKVHDLSGAILSLKNSLWYNKDNLEARNLLGLVYYQIGEIVAALSEWVISENINDERLHRKENPAKRYLKEVQDNKQVTENINVSIQRYNHAIECCYSDNLDVAVIELKKVLSLNPHYLRARQLLALLYIQKREYSTAERELKKCQRLDVNNTTTLRYLQEVEGELHPSQNDERVRRRGNRQQRSENAPQQENGVIKYTAHNETIIQPVGSHKPGVDGFSVPGGVIGGIIGLIVGAALVAFLVMPARVQSVRTQSANEVRSISSQLDTKDTTISDLTDQVNALKAQQTKETSAEDTAKASDDTRASNDNGLFATANAYINDATDNDTLTDVFVRVDPDTALADASQDFTDLYNNLYAKLRSPMLERYAWDGINLYEGDDPDYEKVISDLVTANKYEDPNDWSMTYVERLWYLADSYNKAYNALSDADKKKSDYQDNAIKYAEMVVQSFPDSDYVTQCSQLLTDLGVDVSSLPVTADTAEGNGGTGAADAAANTDTNTNANTNTGAAQSQTQNTQQTAARQNNNNAAQTQQAAGQNAAQDAGANAAAQTQTQQTQQNNGAAADNGAAENAGAADAAQNADAQAAAQAQQEADAAAQQAAGQDAGQASADAAQQALQAMQEMQAAAQAQQAAAQAQQDQAAAEGQ